MAGTRRLTIVTVFTVTGLLFSGGALKAFADDHGDGGDRGGDKHAKQRPVERTQPQVQVAAPQADHEDSDHARGSGASKSVVVNVAAPQQSVTHAADDGDHGGGGGGDHRGPSVNSATGNHNGDDEDENEHARTPTPTPAMTATPTATGTVTMTPTATPVVVEEEEEDFVTVINGVVFQCEPTDNGQGQDHGRHLGQLNHSDDEALITVINGVQVICEAEEEDQGDD
jgi:hypothetical protein